MLVKVVKGFKDKETKSILNPNLEINISEERFSELTAGPIFVEKIEEVEEVEKVDETITLEQAIINGVDKEEPVGMVNDLKVEKLTVSQLKDLLDQMNIKYDSKAKREELIALIEVGD